MIIVEYLHTSSNKIYSTERELNFEEVETFQSSTDPTALGFVFVADYVPEPEAPIVAEPDWEGLRVALREHPTFFQRAVQHGSPNAFTLLVNSLEQRRMSDLQLSLILLIDLMPELHRLSLQELSELRDILHENNFHNIQL